jgi:hypothetical protein
VAETPISAAVGPHPSPNRPKDVKFVQTLLGKVTPPLSIRVNVTGTMDNKTLSAIREFQSRFMKSPDLRVDPDGRTLWHLNEGFVAKYIHCNPRQRKVLDRDIISAQMWLDVVMRRLSLMDSDAKGKVKNVFHVDADVSMHAGQITLLRAAYMKLRASLNESFPLQCEPKPSSFGAWVDPSDATGTMHFPPNHFTAPSSERTERIIHERSHTILRVHHDGMLGAGALNFGLAPDDDNGFTREQAVNNAYCYGWLATALQPHYMPTRSEIIIGAPRRK